MVGGNKEKNLVRLRVLKNFNDKVTGKMRVAGDEFEVDEKRAKEILASKLNVAEKIEPAKKKEE